MKKLLNLSIYGLVQVLLLVANCAPAKANHILGGELYYDYLGAEDFLVQLRLYSEPTYIGNGALDYSFLLGVYEGTVATQFISLELEAGTEDPIPITAPVSCGSQTSEEFLQLVYSAVVHLPSSQLGYDLVVQRCCFGDEISNVQNPSETGLTLWTHVPPFTDDTNPNSSPRFVPQTEWQLCSDEFHVIANSAWDPDGDDLVYNWTEPLSGGSIMNPAPSPDPPSLALAVNWSPGFSANSPFPSATGSALDTLTGAISLQPDAEGAYVYALQVVELRDGWPLNAVYREMTVHLEESPVFVPVTFEVDMSETEVSVDGLHIAGGFQGWDPSATQLTDPDGDSVYAITVELETGMTHEFKFINGMTWDLVEDAPPACQVELIGNDNRFIHVPEESSPLNYHVCYESCGPCGLHNVLFRVDMANEEVISPDGVHVAGNFQGWDPSFTPLTDDDGDGVWECLALFDTAVMPESELVFKFINGNSWADPNEYLNGEPCSDPFGNRLMELTDQNMVLSEPNGIAAPCFNSCSSCMPPVEVTFRVDMTTQEIVSENGVHIAGSFQGWDPSANPLNDDDGDGIWETTVFMEPGEIQFKFINGNDWAGNGAGNVDNELVTGDCAASGSDNRVLTVGEEPIVYEVCYNLCESICMPNPDPAHVTFRVDMNQQEVSPAGVWVIGNFTSPNWQAGALQLGDDDANGIFEATVLIQGDVPIIYKFTNGDPSTGENGIDYIEESGMQLDSEGNEISNFELSGCGVPNGFGAYNRLHVRSGVDETLSAVCFNSCSPCSGCEGTSDVFISECVEGTGNNKAIELYNPTANWINLSSYELQRWSNGEATATDVLPLEGMLAPHATHVLVNGQTEDVDLGGGAISPACDPALQMQADQLGNVYPDPLYFNGDDALVLVKNNTTVVDIFGKPGEDPGVAWTDDADNCFIDVGDGAEWLTSNHTLRRLPSVIQGVTVPPACFDVLAEWEVLDVDNWTGLGWHTIDCEVASSGCMDPEACNYNATASEDDGSCTYPGCQDPEASNYDASAGCAGECLYLTYNCSSIGDEAWTAEGIGLFPGWQQAMHGVEWAGEWVLNIPATIVEPGSGVVYGIHHMDWSGLEGLPDWVESASYELGELDASTQHCIAASGTPAAPGLHELTATGEVFISIFGQPFSIGEQSFSAWLEVAENPNPIPGCTYANAVNFVSYANDDDGSCLFAGCTDSIAANFNPIATIDDGSCGEACDPAGDSTCQADNDGDGVITVTDLLILLGEFGATCE